MNKRQKKKLYKKMVGTNPPKWMKYCGKCYRFVVDNTGKWIVCKIGVRKLYVTERYQSDHQSSDRTGKIRRRNEPGKKDPGSNRKRISCKEDHKRRHSRIFQG